MKRFALLAVLAVLLSACLQGGNNKTPVAPAFVVSASSDLTETYRDTEGRITNSTMINAIAPCKGEVSQDRNAIYYTEGCEIVFSRGIRIQPEGK